MPLFVYWFGLSVECVCGTLLVSLENIYAISGSVITHISPDQGAIAKLITLSVAETFCLYIKHTPRADTLISS